MHVFVMGGMAKDKLNAASDQGLCCLHLIQEFP